MFGWWLLACATPDPLAETRAILQQRGEAPLDPCQPGWARDALDALNRAHADDPAATLRAILAREPAMAPLDDSDLFRRWMQMRRAAVDTDAHLEAFLKGTGGWHQGPTPPYPRHLSFEPHALWVDPAGQPARSGTWTVADGTLTLDLDGTPRTAHLVAGPYGFTLAVDGAGIWSPDPSLGGCD